MLTNPHNVFPHLWTVQKKSGLMVMTKDMSFWGRWGVALSCRDLQEATYATSGLEQRRRERSVPNAAVPRQCGAARPVKTSRPSVAGDKPY
jgi:hypothetical protein